MDLFTFSKAQFEADEQKAGKQAVAREAGLNSCQLVAFEKLQGLENVFLTGVAGSGKSHLIRHFLRNLDRKEFPVLASTGAAAILVGGRTFHSFFGLGILQGGEGATVERALGNSRVVRRLKKTRGVVIDEISMISGTALRVAETIAREARDSEEPWGGLRIISVGDFAQLPPVEGPGGRGRKRDWAFLEGAWERSRFQTALLKTIMRTSDLGFLEVLNRIRSGRVDDEVSAYLNARVVRAGDEAAEFEGTRLFPHRASVERFNLERLARIEAPVATFPTQYLGEERFILEIKKTAPLPEVLTLKEGALIMLRQNDPAMKWVNGSLGQIEQIQADKTVIRVRLLESGREVEIEPVNFTLLNGDGIEVAVARNFPINLAYAATIHKAQGMTLDRVMVDLRHLWEPGQAYVALSRVKSGDGLFLTGWTPSSIHTDSMVARFYQGVS